MATKYANGQVPTSALVQIRDRAGNLEPYHWSSPYAARQWYLLRDWVYETYGVTLHITPGKNAYRDLAGQRVAKQNACAAGNCLGAADEGTSSHGGTWKNWKYTNGVEVDAMAFDIGDWSQLTQAAWYAAARKFGFKAGWITPDIAGGYEPWHIIMLDPWRAVPKEEDDMSVTMLYTKFNADQPVDKSADYIYFTKGTTKGNSSVLVGETNFIGGVLDIELEHPQPTVMTNPDGSKTTVPVKGTFQVQAHIVAVDSTGKTTPVGALGIHEITPTSGHTMCQVPIPPKHLAKGQRLRFKIAATDGLTGKIVSCEFRGAKA